LDTSIEDTEDAVQAVHEAGGFVIVAGIITHNLLFSGAAAKKTPANAHQFLLVLTAGLNAYDTVNLIISMEDLCKYSAIFLFASANGCLTLAYSAHITLLLFRAPTLFGFVTAAAILQYFMSLEVHKTVNE